MTGKNAYKGHNLISNVFIDNLIRNIFIYNLISGISLFIILSNWLGMQCPVQTRTKDIILLRVFTASILCFDRQDPPQGRLFICSNSASVNHIVRFFFGSKNFRAFFYLYASTNYCHTFFALPIHHCNIFFIMIYIYKSPPLAGGRKR